jgi:mannose-6-phosphate isomerase-like protein (cupin superfamily)
MFVIKEPKNYSFDKIGHKGKIFPSESVNNKTQFILLEIENGIDVTLCQHECDYAYYVLEGSGFFEINGAREDCGAGDLVVIPAGNKFTYKGKMKMLLNCTPPWTEAQEETIN